MVQFIFMFIFFGVGLFIGKYFFLSGKELKEVKEAEAELDAKLKKFNELDKQLKAREQAIESLRSVKVEKKDSAKQLKK